MGDSEEKQRGFDYWLSFKGQGVYVSDPAKLKAKGRFVPQAINSGFNINGKKVPQQGYITDELTDYAEKWLVDKDKEKPFLLYVSHKGVHADFLLRTATPSNTTRSTSPPLQPRWPIPTNLPTLQCGCAIKATAVMGWSLPTTLAST